jgi:hypothetical protein
MTATHRRSRLFVSFGLALALAGAALPSIAVAQDGPETPVRGLLAAIAEKDFENAAQFFCPEFADQAAQLDLGAALAGSLPPGVDPQVAADGIAFAVTGPEGAAEPVLSVGTVDPNGTRIAVDAVLTAGLDPDGSEAFVRAIVIGQLEQQGMEVTDENVAAFMTLVESRLADMEMFTQPIQTTLVVTQGEDGTWLICSPLLSASPSAGATGAPEASAAS